MSDSAFIPTGSSRQSSTEKVYDPASKRWVSKTTYSSVTEEGVSVSPSQPLKTTTATPSVVQSSGNSSPTTSKVTSQTDTKTSADKKIIDQEFNTLNGDMEVTLSPDTFNIVEGSTIYLHGVGKNLSGLYFVSNVRYSLSSSDGLSISLNVIKTGFRDSLKSTESSVQEETSDRPKEIDKSVDSVKAGDKVRIVGEDATYSNADDGVKVPSWVKERTLTVSQVSKDSSRVLLSEINSWTYTKFVQRV